MDLFRRNQRKGGLFYSTSGVTHMQGILYETRVVWSQISNEETLGLGEVESCQTLSGNTFKETLVETPLRSIHDSTSFFIPSVVSKFLTRPLFSQGKPLGLYGHSQMHPKQRTGRDYRRSTGSLRLYEVLEVVLCPPTTSQTLTFPSHSFRPRTYISLS